MIQSTSSSDRSAQSGAISAPLSDFSSRALKPSRDQVSTDQAEFLKAELARQPEVRPDVVARGKALAADSSYPPVSVISKVASQILNSPDLSEDAS
jgi:hypothetical protein